MRALALLLAGCSFTMQAAPTTPRVEDAPACTHSATPPHVDTVGAIAGTIAFIALLTQVFRPRCGAMDINGGTECTWVYPTAIGSGLVAAGFGFSAYRGHDIYSACDRAVVAHDNWVASKPSAPRAPSPPAPESHTSLIVGGIVASVVVTGVAVIAIGVKLSEGFHL